MFSMSSTAGRMSPFTSCTRRCEMIALRLTDRSHQERGARFVGKEVDHAREGVMAAVRMQRRETQMAGLRVLQRGLKRVAVAALADQDHVGRFAHRADQRIVIGRVSMPTSRWLTMLLLVLEHELDRVLDREDVARASGCGDRSWPQAW